MSKQSKPEIPDAYQQHVERMRARRAQEPEDTTFEIAPLSENAMNFLGAALDIVEARSEEMKAGKREVERALLNAVRDRMAEEERRNRPVALEARA